MTKATILVIEDDDASRQLVTYLLESAGHRVLAAENGALGLGLALAERPDLILCDLQMPVMNGYEATRQIHALAPKLPIVGQTAHALAEERAACLEAGMVDHISKPIDPDTLLDMILRHTGHHD